MKSKKFEFTAEPWNIINEQIEYKTKIFNLLKRDMIHKEENQQGAFFTLDPPDWINVIALTEDEEIVLVEQYRFGTQSVTLEIPGGMIDPGEQALETAKRELLEETGYAGLHWESLGKVSSNPAIQTNYTHMYLATGCRKVQDQDLGEHELINVHKVPINEFLELVEVGIIHHALVVAAVGKYLLLR